MAIELRLVPCLTDNYGVLIRDTASGRVAAIDAPDAGALLSALDGAGWRLTDVFVTHHHGDHVQGIPALKAAHGCRVTAPAAEAARIPGVDATVVDGDRIAFGDEPVEVIATPGHTLGHVVYHLPRAGLLFAGDTLFAMGCGRLFEGTAADMWASLVRLRALPPETRVYCGHEYTLSNARFAVSVDPDNPALAARFADVEAVRARGEPTLPTTIGMEIATNPFLGADLPSIQAALGMSGEDPARVFGELRERKNRF